MARANRAYRGPRLRYDSVRAAIQTGDILLFVGNGPISRLIRWGSDATYSHCGIAAWEGQRLMLFHAVIHGVKYVSASESVDRYNGRVDWWTLRPDVAAPLDREGVVREAQRHLGKPFAVAGLLRLMVQITRGRYRSDTDLAETPAAMFCSWYVSHCYRIGGGVDLVPESADDCTSPAQIENSELLQLRGTLHR